MKLIITGFPMAPSANALYSGGRYNGKSRRWKSEEYHRFLRKAQTWAAKNQFQIKQLKDAAEQANENGLFLKVDTYFGFSHEQLWTQGRKGYVSKKTGELVESTPKKPKMLDASNRIKAMHDFLAAIIGRDDLYFWAGHYEKFEVEKDDEPEVVFVISPHNPKTMKDLMSEIYPKGKPDEVPVLPRPSTTVGI